MELKSEHLGIDDDTRQRHTRSLWESRRGELDSATPVSDYSAQLDRWDDEEQMEQLAQWRADHPDASGSPTAGDHLSAVIGGALVLAAAAMVGWIA